MTAFDIENYLNSLSEDISKIDISDKDITYLPDLTRFKKLEELICCDNRLTSLPALPENLKLLDCSNNELTLLPALPENLQNLFCYNNKLTYLADLPENLELLYCFNNILISLPTLSEKLAELDCSYNKLTSLPTLPEQLKGLYCSNNKLNSLPMLPKNIEILFFGNNPIYEIIIQNDDTLLIAKQKINNLNKFRHLYYCLKFKKRFRKCLWEKVREPKIVKKYHPRYLIEHFKEDENADIDEVFNNW